MKTHEFYMKQALAYGEKARDLGEVPVGALVVKDGVVIGVGYNRRECDQNPLAHAEIEAITMASKTLNSWRLMGCVLYVTLEPCMMCCGAILNSRIPLVVFGARDEKSGCLGSVLHCNHYPFNHSVSLISGILEEECSFLLSDFFSRLREIRKEKNKNSLPPISHRIKKDK